MLDYRKFINNRLNEEEDPIAAPSLSAEVRNNPVHAPATVTPAPTPVSTKNKLNDDIQNFINKHKNQQKQQADALTLKLQSYRGGQAIDIKLSPNIEIKAQVIAEGKRKYCKLLKSNIEEISILLGQKQPNQQSNIIDPVTNQPIKAEQVNKPVYFQTFQDKTNIKLTWFYFYTTDFVRNSKAKPIFSKTYSIISVS